MDFLENMRSLKRLTSSILSDNVNYLFSTKNFTASLVVLDQLVFGLIGFVLVPQTKVMYIICAVLASDLCKRLPLFILLYLYKCVDGKDFRIRLFCFQLFVHSKSSVL